jgi:gas vesicle protein
MNGNGNMIINRLPWFLTGLGAGVTLGILFAPQPGEESRRLIGRKTQSGTDFLTSRVNERKGYIKRRGRVLEVEARDLIDRGKNAVKQQKDQFSSAFKAGSEAFRSHVKDGETRRVPSSA